MKYAEAKALSMGTVVVSTITHQVYTIERIYGDNGKHVVFIGVGVDGRRVTVLDSQVTSSSPKVGH